MNRSFVLLQWVLKIELLFPLRRTHRFQRKISIFLSARTIFGTSSWGRKFDCTISLLIEKLLTSWRNHYPMQNSWLWWNALGYSLLPYFSCLSWQISLSRFFIFLSDLRNPFPWPCVRPKRLLYGYGSIGHLISFGNIYTPTTKPHVKNCR